MDINKYAAFFHDGSIIDIENFKNGLVISMSSTEMLPEDYDEPLVLDKFNCIRGKLYIKDIGRVIVNDIETKDPIIQPHDYAEIFDFVIKYDKIRFVGEWKNNSMDSEIASGFFIYEIFAKNIYWESIPDLIDPFLD